MKKQLAKIIALSFALLIVISLIVSSAHIVTKTTTQKKAMDFMENMFTC